MTPEKLDDVMRRALQFQMMELPGQWPMMHMGTLYLVNDLARAVSELRADRTPDPAQIRADALQELCDDLLHLGDDLTYFPALAYHNLHIKAYDIRSRLFALIDLPLSPTAVDGSPAPDAGGKGPCNECFLPANETCDICGAVGPSGKAGGKEGV